MIRLKNMALKAGKLVPKKRHKFNARKTKMDGYTFDSAAEADRYAVLRQMEQAKQILDLKVHPLFPLEVRGVHIASYEADFSYLIHAEPTNQHGAVRRVVEDVKALRLPDFVIKWKLAQALYPGMEFRLFDVLDGKSKRWTQSDLEALENRRIAAGTIG